MHPKLLSAAWLAQLTLLSAPALAQSPDYSLAANWAATAASEGSAATIPPGASPRLSVRNADIFYIHPTTDRRLDRDNQPLDDSAVNAWTDASVIARQASAFNRCCNVFAPRYRQATIGSSRSSKERREAAMALAYTDVLAAFDHYMAHQNRGRPFVLVGHSQGAAHLERLLVDRVDGRPLQDKLVAAYVVGIGFTEGLFGRLYSSLSICDTPRQTGCVVHWNSMQTNGAAKSTIEQAASNYRSRFGVNDGATILCVNPLSFDRSKPLRDKRHSDGAVQGAPDDTPVGPVIKGAVAARCENGLLMVEADPTLGLTPLANGSMHYHDIGLFYEDMRKNADARVRAFVRKRRR